MKRHELIAYLRSQGCELLLEVAGEALERMTPEGGETCVRLVCNSCLNALDVQTVAPET